MSVLTRHPLSTAFGQMSEEEFHGLKESVADIGVQEAVCLLEGQVLDGWHRYRAATELGLPYRTFNLQEGIDPQKYVLAKNKDRRNQSASQRALAVAEVYSWKPPSRPRLEKKPAAAADLPAEAPKTTRELAEIAGVGTRTMEHAKAVVKSAAPEVREAVREGSVSVEKAAHIATSLPRSEQAVAMIDPDSSAADVVHAEHPVRPKKHTNGADIAGSDDTVALHSRIIALEAEVADLIEKNSAGAVLLQEMHDDLLSAHAVIEEEAGAARIKEALAEAKKFREYNRTLEDRIRSLQGERNAAIQEAKKYQRQVQRGARAH